MTILIKKYKNRRLYDTDKSQYITLETLHHYVLEEVEFKVEDAATGEDLTNALLLQILVETSGQSSQLFSTSMLKQLIILANHPLQTSFKEALEAGLLQIKDWIDKDSMFDLADKFTKQMKTSMTNWQDLFKK